MPETSGRDLRANGTCLAHGHIGCVPCITARIVNAERARLRSLVEGTRARYTCECGGIGCHEAEARQVCDELLALLAPDAPEGT